ncbi:MAG: leucine-rich repeat domain-containing protein [Dolichospermum sp.]
MTDQELLQIIEKAARDKETTLDLRNNQLTRLPEAIAQLSNLRVLDLSYNQLTTLPEAIAQLSPLSVLNLSDNQLTTLPEAIAQLSHLRELDLSYNQLKTLPEAIAQLSPLSVLNLSYNQLTTLPEAIAQLSHLSLLYLSNNQLTTLPEAIQQLSQLEKLDLRGNHLNIPEEILGSSWNNLGKPSEILTYYFSVQTEEQQPLNEAKVLLVGQGTVGKTSLVKRLIKNRFEPISAAERGIALAMALAVLIAFIVLILNPRSMNGNALAIVRFLASAFAGIAGYLVSGDLGLQSSIPFMKTKTQVKTTGAFAAFVLVFLLFYMGVPTSEIPQPTPTP